MTQPYCPPPPPTGCPVRKMYSQGTSALTFPSKLIMEEDYVVLDEDESSSEQQEEQSAKKLLPDRSKAARNRANDKLVHFIIKQRRVEKRLLVGTAGWRDDPRVPSVWLYGNPVVLSGPRLALVLDPPA